MAAHNDLGKYGEGLAKDYLVKAGFSVLYCNWTHPPYEIDMIASKADKLHFIEVKTRRSRAYGFPEESVNKKKFLRLQKAAEQFLYKYPQWKWVQYDVLSIFIDKNNKADYFFIEDVYLT
jgi:putative endonuclease